MSTMRQRTLSILILAAALPACRKRETAAPSVAIDRSGKTVTIRTAESAAPGVPAAFPAGFPKDVPMYPGALAAASLEAGEAAGHVATFETSDWPDHVAKFYAGKLSGWKTAMDMKSEDAHTLLLRSPDGKRSLTLAARREALKTVVTLTASAR